MPRKTVVPTINTAAPVVAVAAPVVPAPVTVAAPAATTTKKVIKVVKKKKPVDEIVSENLEPAAAEPTTTTTTTPTEAAAEPAIPAAGVELTPETETVAVEDKADKKKPRRQVTKESLHADFEAFFKTIETDFADNKSLVKTVKQLKADSYKLLKIRNLGEDRKKGENNNSGFMKPVRISDDLASFIGVDNDQQITRVLITKKICQHIKEQDLQNPKDRREILPDLALKKLFAITDADTEPLTYYGIQKRIQRHIFKTEPAAAAAIETPIAAPTATA
jgi:chromatin remodeling complex protein RSC6